MAEQDTEKMKQRGENFAVDKSGSVVPLDRKETVAGVCTVSYTDCTDKKGYTVYLQPGQTFYYGDWNGSQCVRKEYQCNE